MQNKKIIFEMFRALAVLLVVLGHFVSSSPDIPSVIKISIESIAVFGVPLFFILSGFLLSKSLNYLLLRHDILSAIKLFYIKRIKRIYPAYFISLIILSLYYNIEILDFIVHIFNIHNFYDEYNRSINAVYWSLAVEFQWYIIAPAIIISHLRIKIIGLILFLIFIFISISARFYFLNDYFNEEITISMLELLAQDQLYIHMFNFSIGILVYRFRNIQLKLQQRYLVFILFLIIILGYWQRGLVENIINFQVDIVKYKIISIYISIILLGLFVHSLLAVKITEKIYWKPIVSISTISYSLYIYHFPILYFINSYNFPWLYSLIAYIFLSLLLSTISYYYVERYFLSQVNIKN